MALATDRSGSYIFSRLFPFLNIPTVGRSTISSVEINLVLETSVSEKIKQTCSPSFCSFGGGSTDHHRGFSCPFLQPTSAQSATFAISVQFAAQKRDWASWAMHCSGHSYSKQQKCFQHQTILAHTDTSIDLFAPLPVFCPHRPARAVIIIYFQSPQP